MKESLTYSAVDFSRSLEASFIGSNADPDERYAPRILSNTESSGNVLSVLKSELRTCTSFDFSVAFITAGGIQVLTKILADLQTRGIRGRILTSTYLNFNEPDALRKLLEYENIESRVYQGDLHAKGYFFDKDAISTIIIGSSNLTQTALTCSKEWNVLFRTFPQGEMLHQIKSEFEKLWDDQNTVPITESWIASYERFLNEHPTEKPEAVRSKRSFRSDGATSALGSGATAPLTGSQPTESSFGIGLSSGIRPNKMQESALEALDVLHRRHESRALLVSATGTGKTYLSALDVASTKPSRVLFIAHRQRILDASMTSYRRVLGGSYTYGMFSDKTAQDATCLFAMVVQLSGKLDQVDPEEFDYIIIDEAHRCGAESYRKVLDHFKPKFVLGMTATPSRTDGYDVYSLFNHVIAYRITLQDALENDMLVPFHYFGIADLAIDEESVDDFELFSQLTSCARVDHIVGAIETYSVRRKHDRRGLVFCSRNDEARELSRLFNERGYSSVAISGQSSDADRDSAIAYLERGQIQYIFSVDILNEGIDIPSLNQIIMLRKTESAIVFVQQLGRGLRKDPSKDYTLVLDFIGNYQQNYLIPIALAGDHTYNKDNLRKVVKEGSSLIPGCSTISFDRVSEQRIFKALEQGKFGSAKFIRSEYDDLRRLLGRIPSLLDFDENDSVDPLLIISKYGSYQAFLQQYEPHAPFSFDAGKLAMLKFISTKMAAGKRKSDLDTLLSLIEDGPERLETPSSRCAAEKMRSVVRTLSGEYSSAGQELIVRTEDGLVLSGRFEAALGDAAFRACVLDVIRFGIARAERDYADAYKDTDFVLNKKYTREDVCRLLRWSREPNYQNVGGYFHDTETNTFPVFVNYEKDPDISITTQYQDRFVSSRRIIAISKSKRTLESPEIVKLRHARENGMRCYLFLRKNKNDKDNGTEFYFLGEMHPTGCFEQIVMADGKTSAVEIEYDLETPVRADLYDYFLSDFDES